MNQTNQIRVGLIGYGFAGRTFHAPVITTVPQLKLAKIVQRTGNTLKERYPWVEIVRDVQDLYQDETIDLVVITTPSTNHFEFARDALAAGKHVIVEKPFTTTTAEADELIRLAKEKGKVLSVFHNRRWDGDFLTLKEIVQQQLLGTVKEAVFQWNGYRPLVNPARWRESAEKGSGTFYDLGVHFLDQALNLFGVPAAIDADIRKQRDGAEADDYFDVQLMYNDGLKVRLKSSMLVREPEPRYVLHGTKGSFVKYGIDPQEAALIAGQTPDAVNWGKEAPELWGKLNTNVGALHMEGRIETHAGCYPAYFQNVAEHILGQSELAVKAEEARMTIRLIELAYQSAAEQKTIIVDMQ
ncbi:oxidoreductase [Marinicrinis lubricantis]|uniref:Oxidoreductase n=1 Tax=Marinicrinis lubricantis TaxID=2086470 RepID=A0ABW1IJL0_9BACL